MASSLHVSSQSKKNETTAMVILGDMVSEVKERHWRLGRGPWFKFRGAMSLFLRSYQIDCDF